MSISAPISPLVGTGSGQSDLSPSDLREILADALAGISRGSMVLAIVADKTRDDNTDVLFPLAAQILQEHNISRYDALIAQGTHSPMSDQEKRIRSRSAARTELQFRVWGRSSITIGRIRRSLRISAGLHRRR